MSVQLDQDSIEAIIKVATEYYADGDLEGSHRMLQGLVHVGLGDARPYKLLGCIYFRQERHTAAIQQYQRAAELDGDDLYVWVALAELYLITLQLSRCIEALRTIAKLDPDARHPASARAKNLTEKYLAKLA